MKNAKIIGVVMTDPPPGVEPNLLINPGRPVSVGGYFFKVHSFDTEEVASKSGRHVVRKAPILFTKSVVVKATADWEESNVWQTAFLPMVFTTIGLLSLFVLGVAWYFRRGDRAAKRVIEAKRGNPFDGETTEDSPT